MNFSKLLIPLPFMVFIVCCKESNIIGYWKRADVINTSLISTNTNNRPGELVILSDSIFLITGDDKKDTSHISGWHVGDNISGTWSKTDKTHLILYANSNEEKYPLVF